MRRLVAGFVLGVLLSMALPATAADKAAPCYTVRYRRHVVAVLGTSEELLGSAHVAFLELRAGHTYKARVILHDLNAYLPTYWQREGAVIRRSVGCGL
jgi:hypothetical protein